MVKRSSPSNTKTLVGLIAILIVVIVVINKFSKNADIQDYSKYKEKADLYKQLAPFPEETRMSALPPFVGFWQFNKVQNDQSTPWTNDRIEIKDNGIIWRVRTAVLNKQSGDTVSFMHASTAYIRPFAKFKSDSQKVIFDVRIIQQSYIGGTDTCYGQSNFDTTWEMDRTSDGLAFSNYTLTPFDTTDLKHFFPEGAIATVDAVSLNKCSQGFSLEKYSKDNGINLPVQSAGTLQKEAQ
jgi:hypothetical protein